MKEITFDLKGKSVGRAASEVAKILMGKNEVDFSPNKVSPVTIKIKNAGLLKMDISKMYKKKYYYHSGYLGNLREVPLKEEFEKSPNEFFVKVLGGMLPRNRLKKPRLSQVKFLENE